MALLDIVSRDEFNAVVIPLLSRLESLEAQLRKQEPKALLSAKEAAAMCRITPESLARARRDGRIKGVKANEKEYAYYQHDLEAYLNRYQR
jgi:pyrrolidone-carboxylate peptidase